MKLTNNQHTLKVRMGQLRLVELHFGLRDIIIKAKALQNP